MSDSERGVKDPDKADFDEADFDKTRILPESSRISGLVNAGKATPSANETILEAAVQRGYITLEQHSRLRNSLETSGEDQTAAEMLVTRGFIDEATAQSLSASSGELLNITGYRTIRLLGRGGMGVVYEAIQEKLARRVALKVIRSDLDDLDGLQRFRREALALARLNHPNIVQVYDFGEEGGRQFLCLEFVEGEDLASLLKREGPLDRERALRFTCEAARGLAHAHAQGLIHRDVKPANILLGKARDKPKAGALVKISDLGLVREDKHAGADGITVSGTVMGTPAYMSPEQSEGESVDHRADIYALGATLFHMLVGEVPFPAANAMKMLLRKRSEALVLPKSIPEDLQALLYRMMARFAEHRYQDYGALIEDLEALLRGESLEASSQSPRPIQAESPLAAAPLAASARASASASSLRVALLGLLLVAAFYGLSQIEGLRRETPKPPVIEFPDAPEVPKPKPGDPGPDPKPTGEPKTGEASGDEAKKNPEPKNPEPPSESKAEPPVQPEPPAAKKSLERLSPLFDAVGRIAPLELVTQNADLVRLAGLVDGLDDEVEVFNGSLRLRELVTKAIEDPQTGVLKALEGHYAAGRYEDLATLCERTITALELVDAEPGARIKELTWIAAQGRARGKAEREAWQSIQEAPGPVELLERSAKFAEDFSFSPVLSEVAKRRAEAELAAPELQIDAPEGLRVLLGERELASGPWRGRLKRGRQVLTLISPSGVKTSRVFKHEGKAPLELFASPSTKVDRRIGDDAGLPVFNPRLFPKGWMTKLGSWRAREDFSGLEADAGESRAETRRELASLIKTLAGSTGFSLSLQLVAGESCALNDLAAEVGLAGSSAERAVLGISAGLVQFGSRREEGLEIHSSQVWSEKRELRLRMDFEGGLVAAFIEGEFVGALRLDGARDLKLILSVDSGTARFQDFSVRGLSAD